jgi:hypothetical protein
MGHLKDSRADDNQITNWEVLSRGYYKRKTLTMKNEVFGTRKP